LKSIGDNEKADVEPEFLEWNFAPVVVQALSDEAKCGYAS